MDHLKGHGWQGLSLGQALQFAEGPNVTITFDDGCETDLLAAAPILRQAGFNATFFITVGRLGKPGYLSKAQVKELSEGFEIGSHSMTHAYLTDLDESGLRHEICDSKLPTGADHRETGRPLLMSWRTLRSASGGSGSRRWLQDTRHQPHSGKFQKDGPLCTGARRDPARYPLEHVCCALRGKIIVPHATPKYVSRSCQADSGQFILRSRARHVAASLKSCSLAEKISGHLLPDLMGTAPVGLGFRVCWHSSDN